MNLLYLICLLTTFSSFAKEFKCADDKHLPSVTQGCEGEACDFYHYEKAIEDIILYERPDLTSKKVSIVKRCDDLKDLQTILITKSYGKGNIIKTSPELERLGVKVGDQVPILKLEGEGFLSLCINTKKDIMASMTQITDSEEPVAIIKIIQEPITEPWVKLSSKNGIRGHAPRSIKTVMWYSNIDLSKLCHPSHKKLIKNL